MNDYCEKCDNTNSSWGSVGLIGYSIIVGLLGWSLLDSDTGMLRIVMSEYIPQSWFNPLVGIFLGIGAICFAFLVADSYLIKRNHLRSKSFPRGKIGSEEE